MYPLVAYGRKTLLPYVSDRFTTAHGGCRRALVPRMCKKNPRRGAGARDEDARLQCEAEAAAQRAEEARREHLARTRRDAERKRREALIEEVIAWRQASEIEAYVAAIRKEVTTGREPSEHFLEWERLALGIAAATDPARKRTSEWIDGERDPPSLCGSPKSERQTEP